MNSLESFKPQLYSVNDESFTDIALRLFSYQASQNPIYKAYLTNLGINKADITTLASIPFMPISFFKQHSVKTGAWDAETIFTSSGTTGHIASSHHIYSVQFYLEHAEKCFRHFFNDLQHYHFLALLPSYLERKDSSLVAMVDYFIKKSGSRFSGFYLNDTDKLVRDLKMLKDDARKTVLFGVTFALLDLAESVGPDLSQCLLIETGGMKGRRKEIIRAELHERLRKGLNGPKICSEYGMTELLSQAYSIENELFSCPPWMKVIGRDLSDPMQKGLLKETCGINIIDLANWHSAAFIESEDIGRIYGDGTFEVLGRMDNSDVRGCNLLVN